jgi:plastocyanin
MRWTVFILFLAAGLAGCGGGGGYSSPAPTTPSTSGTGATVAVGIEGDAYRAGGVAAFVPPVVNVTTGTTVTWSNKDQTVHTVTSDSGSFNSGSIGGGSGFSRVFTTPGTYEYHCTVHPYMTGTVIVK